MSRTKCKPYFNLDLQMEDKTEPAVCFSPSKKLLMDDLMVNRKGCMLSNVFRSPDNKSIFMNDYSKMVPFELGFDQTMEQNFLSIKKVITEIPINSKVNVSAVAFLKESRAVVVSDEDVPIREGFLADESGFIKLTLWRNYAELTSDLTYDFKNLLKITYGGEDRLQSIHATTYSLAGEQLDGVQKSEETGFEEATNIVFVTCTGR